MTVGQMPIVTIVTEDKKRPRAGSSRLWTALHCTLGGRDARSDWSHVEWLAHRSRH